MSGTSIAESIGAGETVRMLNDYFSDMVEVVLRYGGLLDKYIGDAIMAVFGAPIVGPRDADDAVTVAIEMIGQLDAFNRRRRTRDLESIEIGIGVATQLVVLPALYWPVSWLVDVDELSRPAEELLDGESGVALAFLGLGVVVIAPIVEELFFRGLLLDTLRRRWSTPAAVIASSVFFSATHFQAVQFAGLTLAGIVFASAVVRTGDKIDRLQILPANPLL